LRKNRKNHLLLLLRLTILAENPLGKLPIAKNVLLHGETLISFVTPLFSG
jgi:hypothetical protein